MALIDSDVRKALELRLVKGEISREEYWRLKAVLTSVYGDASETHTALHREEPLLVFEDLGVFSTHLVVAGKRREFADITEVDGGTTNLIINTRSAINDTSLSVKFADGSSYEVREKRTLGGRNRHHAIMQAYTFIKKATFGPLFDKFVADVRRGPVTIGTTNDAPIATIPGMLVRLLVPKKYSRVQLHPNGRISNGNLILNLTQCRGAGILELGINRSNLNEPQSIYASHQKTWIERSSRSALRFTIDGPYRPDVVMALIDWLANPNNEL